MTERTEENRLMEKYGCGSIFLTPSAGLSPEGGALGGDILCVKKTAHLCFKGREIPFKESFTTGYESQDHRIKGCHKGDMFSYNQAYFKS